MDKPKHEELVSESLPERLLRDGVARRFCLERIARHDEADRRYDYAFTYRGMKHRPNGLLLRPAYFNWPQLGRLIRHAKDGGHISGEQFDEFERELRGSRS